MKKSFVTYLLLSILLIQLLPVTEIGQLLYNNQLTEEICDGFESAQEHSKHHVGKKVSEDEFTSKLIQDNQYVDLYLALYLSKEVIIVSRIFDDTPTPPPLA
jgi:hypothetical protein